MNDHFMQVSDFSGSPILVSDNSLAHSGLELLTELPHSGLAHELAQVLVSESVQVIQAATNMIAHGSPVMAEMIKLIR